MEINKRSFFHLFVAFNYALVSSRKLVINVALLENYTGVSITHQSQKEGVTVYTYQAIDEKDIFNEIRDANQVIVEPGNFRSNELDVLHCKQFRMFKIRVKATLTRFRTKSKYYCYIEIRNIWRRKKCAFFDHVWTHLNRNSFRYDICKSNPRVRTEMKGNDICRIIPNIGEFISEVVDQGQLLWRPTVYKMHQLRWMITIFRQDLSFIVTCFKSVDVENIFDVHVLGNYYWIQLNKGTFSKEVVSLVKRINDHDQGNDVDRGNIWLPYNVAAGITGYKWFIDIMYAYEGRANYTLLPPSTDWQETLLGISIDVEGHQTTASPHYKYWSNTSENETRHVFVANHAHEFTEVAVGDVVIFSHTEHAAYMVVYYAYQDNKYIYVYSYVGEQTLAKMYKLQDGRLTEVSTAKEYLKAVFPLHIGSFVDKRLFNVSVEVINDVYRISLKPKKHIRTSDIRFLGEPLVKFANSGYDGVVHIEDFSTGAEFTVSYIHRKEEQKMLVAYENEKWYVTVKDEDGHYHKSELSALSPSNRGEFTGATSNRENE